MPQHDTVENAPPSARPRWGRRALLLGGLILLMSFPILSWFSQKAPPLGVVNGRLQACPDSPNCVNSEATDEEHQIAPLAFQGDPAAAMEQLRKVVAALPRTTIVTAEGDYLRAACTTALMRYVDDVEFRLDAPAQVIQVRSASRVGYSDMGVNRKRVEQIRQRFAAAMSAEREGA